MKTNPTNKTLKILQWNLRSLTLRKAHLINLITNHELDIIILSETWLKENYTFKIKGFNIVEKCRNNTGYGGVAILISQELDYKEVNLTRNINSNIEICAAQIQNSQINFISVYKPPDVTVSQAEWSNIFQQIPNKKIICGDYCHHTTWRCQTNSSQGSKLIDAIDEEELVIMNNGSPTRLYRPNQSPAAVDLTFVSPDIAHLISWEVLTDPMGSDHFPILLTLNTNIDRNVINPATKWNDNRAHWMTFQSTMNNKIINSNFGTNNNDEMLEMFKTAISEAADASMPQKKPFKPKVPNQIWWDDECRKTIAKRKETLNNYKRLSNMENYIAYKNIEAATKVLLKRKQRESWRAYINKLNKSTPPREIWKIVKSLNNKTVSRKQLSSDLIESLLDIYAPATVVQPALEHIKDRTGNFSDDMWTPFTINELNLVLKNVKSTSPGIDGITYSMLYNLTDIAKHVLLRIFNLW
nr:unnamed protein product [Callosobruchus chinensis]